MSNDPRCNEHAQHHTDFFNATGATRESYLKVVHHMQERINYSERYRDDQYEYRHVRLPREYEPLIPARLMTEAECRLLGVTQSPGWQQYMIHRPEPWVLLFRRPIT